MAAWRAYQPDVEYVLWNDSSAAAVRHGFGGQEAVDAYAEFPPAQKKDLFMYVLLAERGGLFADCDVRPLRPPGGWLRELGSDGEEVLLGLEARGSEEQMEFHQWGACTQLAVWAAASRPNSSVFGAAARSVLRSHRLRALAGDYMSTIQSTGPGLLTRVVEAKLAERELSLESFRSISGDWHSDVHAGIRILGIDGFGCGQPHSASSPCEEANATALVKHEFAGTWKWLLCKNASAAAFTDFATMQSWDGEDWFRDLRRQAIWTDCGPPGADADAGTLWPLFAPPYPPQLPRPPPRCDRLCAVILELVTLPPLLPAPNAQRLVGAGVEEELPDEEVVLT